MPTPQVFVVVSSLPPTCATDAAARREDDLVVVVLRAQMTPEKTEAALRSVLTEAEYDTWVDQGEENPAWPRRLKGEGA